MFVNSMPLFKCASASSHFPTPRRARCYGPIRALHSPRLPIGPVEGTKPAPEKITAVLKAAFSIRKEDFMAGKNTAAFGIFPTRAGAEHCVDALLAAGFRGDDVSV